MVRARSALTCLSPQKMSNEASLRNRPNERQRGQTPTRGPPSIDSLLPVRLRTHLHTRDIVCHTRRCRTCPQGDRLDTFARRMLISRLGFPSFRVHTLLSWKNCFGFGLLSRDATDSVRPFQEVFFWTVHSCFSNLLISQYGG